MSPSRYLSQLGPRALSWVVFAAIFGGAAAALGYLYGISVGHKDHELRRHVRDLAEAAAGLVEVERHERLTDPAQAGTDDYRQALEPLLRFHRAHESLQYVWTVRVEARDEQRLVLLTSTDSGIRRRQESLGRGQVLIPFLGPNSETAVGRGSLPTLRAGRPVVFPDIYRDEYGRYIEARAPLFDRAGRFVGYAGVDYALDSYFRQLNEVRFAGGVALVLALGLGLALARGAYRMREETRATLAALAEQRDVARRANEAKSELLRIATHDLKNPLAAIGGMSGILLKLWRNRPDQAAVAQDVQVLETIHGSAKHMSEIVRGILTNEGIERGDLPFAPAPADLGALLAEVLRFNAPAAQKKAIAVRSEAPASLVATVDAGLVREAFDNYVSNAIKYSPPGKPIAVELRRAADGATLEFAVRDEGPGLSAEDRKKLFGKFQKLTPRPTGGESSTGLGLSIVKTVAERHGGSVGCDTEPGRGARFWLRLPANPGAGISP